MLTRRLIACTCALALAVPAAAAAVPAQDPPAAYGSPTVAGDTKSDLQNKQDLGAPSLKGDTKSWDVRAARGQQRRGDHVAERQAARRRVRDLQARREAGGHAARRGRLHRRRHQRLAHRRGRRGGLARRDGALGAAALVGRARPRRGAAA